MTAGRRRTIILALVACLAVWAPGAAAAARGGRYVGKTAQGYKLRARLGGAGERLFLVRFKVKLRCRDGGLLFDDLSDFEATEVESGGRFADLQLGPSDEVSWRGRVKGKRISGSLRVKDKVAGGVQCDSGTVRFVVRRGG
jgi:hypothetical protein